ncbi:hypothetical protein ACFV5N_00760 [Streptomyces sp. NPDC059853]
MAEQDLRDYRNAAPQRDPQAVKDGVRNAQASGSSTGSAASQGARR